MSEEKSVLRATYHVTDYFLLPKNLDLQDPTQVKSWGVKYNRLEIIRVDNTVLFIDGMGLQFDYDYKHPDSLSFCSAEDAGVDVQEQVVS